MSVYKNNISPTEIKMQQQKLKSKRLTVRRSISYFLLDAHDSAYCWEAGSGYAASIKLQQAFKTLSLGV